VRSRPPRLAEHEKVNQLGHHRAGLLRRFGCAANLAYQLHRDEIVFQRAATAMRQRLYQVATGTGRGVLTRRGALYNDRI
jgi:hypothetical protein